MPSHSHLETGDQAKLLAGLPGKLLAAEALRSQAELFRPESPKLFPRKDAGKEQARRQLLQEVSGLYSDILSISRTDPQLASLKAKNPYGYDQVAQGFALCRIVFREFEMYAPGFVEGNSPVSMSGVKSATRGLELDILRHELKYLRSQTAATPRQKQQAVLSQPLQKTQAQSGAQDVSGQVRALEKRVFEDYLAGKPVSGDAAAMARQLYQDALQAAAGEEREKAFGLLRKLNDGLALNFQLPPSGYDAHYLNFFAMLESGFVQSDGKKEFFLKNLPAFRKAVELVDGAQADARGMSKSIAFEFKTAQEAALFDRGLSQLAVMKFEPGRGTYHTIQKEMQVFFIFSYAVPQAGAYPAPEQIKPTVPSQQPVPIGLYGRTEERGIRRKEKPAEEQLAITDRLASSSGPVDINYNASRQVIYARNFDPESSLSLQIVHSMAKDQLALFCADKGVKLEGMSAKEKGRLLSEMKIMGSATCESPAQYDKNLELAQKRAQMLAREIVLQVIGPKAKASEYFPLMSVEAQVVSPWEIKGKVTKEEAARTLSSFMGAAKEGAAFRSGLLYSTLTGKYEDARAAVRANVSDKKEQKELLDYITAVEKKQGKEAPAITGKEKGWEITNQKLAEALWLSQGSDVGLRFETAKTKGKRTMVVEPGTEKEKTGALFTSLLEANYSRSASLQRKEQAVLSISMGNPGGQYAPGRKVEIPLQVSYRIGDKEGPFSAGGGKVSAKVSVSRGMGEIPSEVKEGKDGRYVLSFIAPASGEVKITAEAVKPDLGISSGTVSATLNPTSKLSPVTPIASRPLERPLEPEVPVPEYEPVKFVTITNIEYGIPQSFAIAGLGYGSETLMGGLKDAYGVFGATYNEQKGTFALPEKIDFNKYLAFKDKMAGAIDTWLNSPDPGTPGNPLVKTMVMKDVREGKFDLFVTALKNGQYAEAKGYLKDSELKNALGEIENSLKNFSTQLTQEQIAELMLRSLSGGVGVKFDLPSVFGAMKTQLHIYLKSDATLLVTNDRLNRNAAGAELLATFDLGNNWKLRTVAGGEIVIKAGDVPQLQSKVGAKMEVPLGEFLALNVGGTLKSAYRGDFSRIDVGQVDVGAKYNISRNLVGNVQYSRVLAPLKPLDSLGAGLGYQTSIFSVPLNIGLSGGIGFRENIKGKRPYSIGVSFTLSP